MPKMWFLPNGKSKWILVGRKNLKAIVASCESREEAFEAAIPSLRCPNSASIRSMVREMLSEEQAKINSASYLFGFFSLVSAIAILFYTTMPFILIAFAITVATAWYAFSLANTAKRFKSVIDNEMSYSISYRDSLEILAKAIETEDIGMLNQINTDEVSFLIDAARQVSLAENLSDSAQKVYSKLKGYHGRL